MTEPQDLFTSAADDRAGEVAPLAVRMRPRTLDEVVGQDHLLAARVAAAPAGRGQRARRRPTSLILWGPPGTGKTTLAHLVAQAAASGGTSSCPRSPPGSRTSARSSTTRGASSAPPGAARCCSSTRCTASPRPSRTRCCPRSRTAGSPWSPRPPRTRPSAIVSPLLSRSLLVTLQPLEAADVRALLERAVADERGLGSDRRRGRRRRAADADPAGGRRRALGADRAGGRRRRRAGRGPHDGRGRRRRAGRRQGGGALRPRRRRALRRHQRVHQVHPRQRRRRRAALPGADGRGRRGPAVRRPPAGDPRVARTSGWPTRRR